MSTQDEQGCTILSIVGTCLADLHILANVYFEPLDPDEISSAVYSLAYTETRYQCEIEYNHETWITRMFRHANGSLFAVSMEGELHTNRTGKWEVVNLGCPNGLNGVWAAENNDIFSVGVGGERIHLHELELTNSIDIEKRELRNIHGSSRQNVFVVGDSGAVSRFNGKEWIDLKVGTKHALFAVLCVSDKEVYIGGAHGMVFRWNGENFEWMGADPETPEAEITIYSLAIYQNKLYAAAGGDGVYVIGDNGLEKIKDVTFYNLNVIGDFMFGVGNRLVARFDGAGWWGGNLDI
ncbi:MAG: hypothetical protein JXR76_30480 [Deltaproteobacteria bacterium]|nr:hypothetical protein [Deltaproteobacteria bacterium]